MGMRNASNISVRWDTSAIELAPMKSQMHLRLREAVRNAARSLVGEEGFASFRGLYWPVKLRLTAYEPETRALSQLIPKGGTCLDVGGNFGQFASYLARAVGREGIVHSFEPLAYNRRILTTVMKRLNLRNVVVHPFAVGSKNGTVRISIPSGNTAEAHVSEVTGEVTDVISLDSWAARQRLDRLDFLKIDVEGFEMEVIRGCQHLLSLFMPVVLCEISGVCTWRYGLSVMAPFQFLEGLGYRSFVWNGETLVSVHGPSEEVINYFFIAEGNGRDFILDPSPGSARFSEGRSTTRGFSETQRQART
jgi:FkbM family methyltransferase